MNNDILATVRVDKLVELCLALLNFFLIVKLNNFVSNL